MLCITCSLLFSEAQDWANLTISEKQMKSLRLCVLVTTELYLWVTR